jgi:hypothetical protein
VRAMRQIHDALPYLRADRSLGHECFASQIAGGSGLDLDKATPIVSSNKRESLPRRLSSAETSEFTLLRGHIQRTTRWLQQKTRPHVLLSKQSTRRDFKWRLLN